MRANRLSHNGLFHFFTHLLRFRSRPPGMFFHGLLFIDGLVLFWFHIAARRFIRRKDAGLFIQGAVRLQGSVLQLLDQLVLIVMGVFVNDRIDEISKIRKRAIRIGIQENRVLTWAEMPLFRRGYSRTNALGGISAQVRTRFS